MDPQKMQEIKQYVGFRRSIASDIHKTYQYSPLLPRGAHSKKAFMQQFRDGWYKTALLKTPVGKVFIDIDGQYNHLSHNSKNQDRTHYSKSIAETLKNPIFIAKYDNNRYKFYKNFIDKNGTIAHIFCIVRDTEKGKALVTMFNVTELKVMKLYEEVKRSLPRNLPHESVGTTTDSVILGNVIVNDFPLISDKKIHNNTEIIQSFLQKSSEIKPSITLV